MSEFSDWVGYVNPEWRRKGKDKVVYVAPCHKLTLKEEIVGGPYMYAGCVEDGAEHVKELYSLIEGYMSIRDEKLLVEILNSHIRDWEENRKLIASKNGWL